MKNKLLIIGASGHGKVAADIALKMNKWESIAFIDDNASITTSMGISVVGNLTYALKNIKEYDIYVGIGDNEIRRKVQNEIEAEGASIPVLIHPTAIIGERVKLGIGTAVMAGAIINCCTSIGKGCIINTGSTIDHDNLIDDFVHISPGVHLAGNIKIGTGSWIGIGSVVSNNINIVNNCKVGAGGVVVKDISQSGTYVGIPVRRIKDEKNSNVS
jgi:sugar O-acyltransferase, sialic acid O-acetyltransferase NeuD family